MGEGKSKQNLITSPALKPFYNALGISLIIRQLPTNATVYNSFESIFGMMEIVLQTFRRWPCLSEARFNGRISWFRVSLAPFCELDFSLYSLLSSMVNL